MASISLSQKRVRGSSGWGSWTSISGQDIVSDELGRYVVYKATLNMSGASSLDELSLSVSFGWNASSGSHTSVISCFLCTSDPTSGSPSSIPSNLIYKQCSDSVTVPYYGVHHTFEFYNLNITSGSTLYFWFVDYNTSAYSDYMYHKATGNGYTANASISGSFTELEKYTVKYDGNGGTAPSTQTFYEGNTIKLASAITRSSSSSSKTFTLTPDANGGTLASTSQRGSCKRTEKTTYTFSNWRSSSGYWYSAGETYGNGWNEGSTTMTAEWDESISYTYSTSISSISNPSHATENLNYAYIDCYTNYGSNERTRLISKRNKKYTFSHWDVNSWETSKVTSTSEFDEDSTIYAIWNGAWTGTATSVTLPALTRENYKFLGYATKATATTATYAAGYVYTPSSTSTVSLYAIWEPEGTVHLFTEDNVAQKVRIHINTDNVNWYRCIPYIHDGVSYKKCK